MANTVFKTPLWSNHFDRLFLVGKNLDLGSLLDLSVLSALQQADRPQKDSKGDRSASLVFAFLAFGCPNL